MPDASGSRDSGIVVGGALTMARDMPDLEMVVAPIAAKRQIITFTGHPGHAKTTFATGLLVHFALGRTFGPLLPETEGIVYFVSAEDLQGTRDRILAEAARLRLDEDDRGTLDFAMRWMQVEPNVSPRAIRDAIVADAGDVKVALIFIDTGPVEGRIIPVEMEGYDGRRYSAPVIVFEQETSSPGRSDAREAREAIVRQLYVARHDPPTVRALAQTVGKPTSTVGGHLTALAGAKPPLVKRDAVTDRYALTKAGEARAKEILCPT